MKITQKEFELLNKLLNTYFKTEFDLYRLFYNNIFKNEESLFDSCYSFFLERDQSMLFETMQKKIIEEIICVFVTGNETSPEWRIQQ